VPIDPGVRDDSPEKSGIPVREGGQLELSGQLSERGVHPRIRVELFVGVKDAFPVVLVEFHLVTLQRCFQRALGDHPIGVARTHRGRAGGVRGATVLPVLVEGVDLIVVGGSRRRDGVRERLADRRLRTERPEQVETERVSRHGVQLLT